MSLPRGRCQPSLTAQFRPEQLVFEPLGRIEGEMARAPAVADGLAYERGSEMTRVRIADGACGRRDRYAIDLFHVFRREIRVVKRQPFGHGPANAKIGRQGHMHLGRGIMTASNDTTNGPGATPIHDQRTAPPGVLPRQLQMWLMIGLAVIILAIILFTGHAAPAPRASAAIRTSDPSLLAPDRIQTYQRQLADDEARLRRELAQAPGPARSGAPTAAARVGEPPPTDPIADEQRRRDYQSLFADNVALSRRPADAPSYAERATPTRAWATCGGSSRLDSSSKAGICGACPSRTWSTLPRGAAAVHGRAAWKRCTAAGSPMASSPSLTRMTGRLSRKRPRPS